MEILDEEVLPGEEDGVRAVVGEIVETVLVFGIIPESVVLSAVLVLAGICETGAEIICGPLSNGVALTEDEVVIDRVDVVALDGDVV